MLVRKLNNNKVKKLELGYNQVQEQEFVKINPNMNYMYVTTLPYSTAYPEYQNYKWENNNIVVDDTENEKQYIADQVQIKKDYLKSTDFKMTADYDQDTTDVRTLRQAARDYIRSNDTE